MPKTTALKSRKVLTIVLAVAVLALVGYGIFSAISRSSVPQFTDGSKYSTIKLPAAGGIYEWSYTIEDTTIAVVTDKSGNIEYENEQDDGGTPIDLYVIEGKKPGKTKITFRYGSFNDGSVIEEHTYLIEVNEKLENRVSEQN
ncbi:MAG: protease inhibitor I42 family protein [Candidatus Saccharibacteria bacterium]|nr:protease inhibitor I42 family protein [Candidatus Saccharibacteria bacterium]